MIENSGSLDSVVFHTSVRVGSFFRSFANCSMFAVFSCCFPPDGPRNNIPDNFLYGLISLRGQ